MDIPVKLVGSAPGVIAGGSLRFPNRTLKVKGLPDNLPDFISADISKLNIGDRVLISDVDANKCTLLHSDTMVVTQVKKLKKEQKVKKEQKEQKEQKVLVKKELLKNKIFYKIYLRSILFIWDAFFIFTKA